MASLEKKISLEKASKILFVEGYSDLTFYAEMLEHLGFGKGDVFIKDLGTKARSKLQDEAIGMLKPSVLQQKSHVGVIFDADTDAEAAFRLAREALKSAFAVDILTKETWVADPNNVTQFGVFIAGSGTDAPEVESLAWAAWSSHDKNQGFKTCIDEFVQCAQKNKQHIQSLDKVRIGAALVVLNEDDPRLGPGTRAKHFDLDSMAFDNLRRFLGAMKETT